MPIVYPYTQYTGIWNLSAASKAKGAGTWPVPPAIRLLAWGGGSSGALGLGNTTSYSSPKNVGSLTTWLSVAAGDYFAIAYKNDGTLWSWGKNDKGQLGLGTITYYSSPKQIGALTNWLNFACGRYHTLATKTDGTLWSWGRNENYGQLGLGDRVNRSSPVQVGSLTTWSYVSAGGESSAAIKTDGTLWTWGANDNLQLGLDLGFGNNRSSPVQVGTLTNWSKVAIGNFHCLAIKTDGTIWSWGNGSFFGPLGLNNLYYYSSPKQIGALTNWASIAVGNRFSTSIKTDGTLWCWGSNQQGQSGFGNTTSYSSPKQVGALTNWSKISAKSFCVSIKTDGTLWSWGANFAGQLGIGNTSYRSSPVQVGALTTWSVITTGGGSTYGIAVT
jgi:hypothetical protein